MAKIGTAIVKGCNLFYIMAVANPADNVSNYKISTKAGKRPKSRRGGSLPLA